VVACVDFGSTFTKAALVEVPSGRLVATAEHRTTIDTDVLDAWDACRAQLTAADPRAAQSSATRSWSLPRPAAVSRCPAAAASCTSPTAG
jgi:hypothetical protein